MDHYIYPLKFHWESETRTKDLWEQGTVVRIQKDLEAKTVILLEGQKTEANHEEAIGLGVLSDW